MIFRLRFFIKHHKSYQAWCRLYNFLLIYVNISLSFNSPINLLWFWTGFQREFELVWKEKLLIWLLNNLIFFIDWYHFIIYCSVWKQVIFSRSLSGKFTQELLLPFHFGNSSFNLINRLIWLFKDLVIFLVILSFEC